MRKFLLFTLLVLILICSFLVWNQDKRTAKLENDIISNKRPPIQYDVCPDDLIKAFENRSIVSLRKVYKFKSWGSTYYYIIPDGNDVYYTIYDSNCQSVCAPNGGFDGNGDGKCSRALKNDLKDLELIWEDSKTK